MNNTDNSPYPYDPDQFSFPAAPIRVTDDNRAAFEGLARSNAGEDLTRTADELLRGDER
jgi:hypothetical protein